MVQNFGVYVHVPFCSSRCDYCAFATWTEALDHVDSYVKALLRELEVRTFQRELPQVKSLYFGGGTPSLISSRYIAHIIEQVNPVPGAEITIECNPESVTAGKLADYKSAGVNRVSFGVQSLSQEVLSALGRKHDRFDIFRAVEAVGEAGIEQYSVDLIYGSRGETQSVLADSLYGILQLDPPPVHVSAYALTVEPGTPLARDAKRHPDEDYQADAYSLVDSVLSDSGYEWYEISNWARPGKHSRHNWNYWMQGEYLGLGCAAHSHIESQRSRNVFSLERYIGLCSQGLDPTSSVERIEGDLRWQEALELLARTRLGVPAASVSDADEIDFLLESKGSTLVLNLRGRLLANLVSMKLIHDTVSIDEIERLQASDPWD